MGLIHVGVRQLEPDLGRWLHPDAFSFSYQPRTLNRYSYAGNNPVYYKDSSGYFIETAWDAVSFVTGVVSFGQNVREGNFVASAVDAVGVVVDGLAVATPFVPGGVGMAIKAGRAGKAVAGAARRVVREGTEKVAREGAEKVAREGAEKVAREGAEKVAKGAAKDASQEVAERGTGKLAGAAEEAAAARGAPKALPAPRTRGNPNPIGEWGTFYVDSKGNVIPTPPGGRITGSPDGRFIQARDAAGNPTGVRIDGPHRPATHPDPRAQQPHGHVPGVTNPDGTPWLPINQ